MNPVFYYVISAVLAFVVLAGLSMQSKVKSAVAGNALSMAAMGGAFLLTVAAAGAWTLIGMWIAVLVGGAAGYLWARKVQMIEMPQMVGALNGVGGLASGLIGALELLKSNQTVFALVTAALAMNIGLMTFSGSLIAALKLSRVIGSRPVRIKGYAILSTVLLALMLISCVLPALQMQVPAFVLGLSSLVFGAFFALRVGGADMPVAISLLNSLSGVAGAVAGMALYNLLLVAVGGIVGSSGLLLTQIMCRSMNRKLLDVLVGKGLPAPSAKGEKAEATREEEPEAATSDASSEGEMRSGADSLPADAASAAEETLAERKEAAEEREALPLKECKDIIIVPGYGMAISQAQHKLRELMLRLTENGARVRFAIHPVAGRMPGHMNVLLCEAEIDYDDLFELDSINDDFASCDAVIVVGASDVLNPAAREAEGTPIYGMPILNVDQAPNIYICNFDLNPGYAGVENPLYSRKNGVRLLLGDAKDSLEELIHSLDS